MVSGVHGSCKIVMSFDGLGIAVTKDGGGAPDVLWVANRNRRCCAISKQMHIDVMFEGSARILADPKVHRMAR